MKLELKHLATYLPYKLKFYNISSEEIFGEVEKIDVYFGKIYLYKPLSWEKVVIDYVNQSESIYKPILRPLSDLSTEHVSQLLLDNIKSNSSNDIKKDLSYNSISILLELHFDVFGLIENGLAIDINSLRQSSE